MQQTENFPVAIGDWVTQYDKGYWQILDIVPIYATALDEENYSIKRGTIRTHYALMKKAFTPLMKPRIAFSYCDVGWCKKVSAEKQAEIEAYYSTHPNDLKKFENAVPNYPMCITNLFLQLDETQYSCLQTLISELSHPFTETQFRKALKSFGLSCCLRSHAPYLLNLCGFPWETDENRSPLFTKIELYHFVNQDKVTRLL